MNNLLSPWGMVPHGHWFDLSIYLFSNAQAFENVTVCEDKYQI
jgi:hypothetical protein